MTFYAGSGGIYSLGMEYCVRACSRVAKEGFFKISEELNMDYFTVYHVPAIVL